jgi:transcriptional regulator with XRE-family HTH domain
MKFNWFLRSLRKERKLGLRKVARAVGMSVTYLSKIERGELPPPSEEKLLALADLFNRDPDELLAMAGRLPSDLPRIISKHPQEYAALLRSMRKLNGDQLRQVICLFYDPSNSALPMGWREGIAKEWLRQFIVNLDAIDRVDLRVDASGSHESKSLQRGQGFIAQTKSSRSKSTPTNVDQRLAEPLPRFPKLNRATQHGITKWHSRS